MVPSNTALLVVILTRTYADPQGLQGQAAAHGVSGVQLLWALARGCMDVLLNWLSFRYECLQILRGCKVRHRPLQPPAARLASSSSSLSGIFWPTRSFRYITPIYFVIVVEGAKLICRSCEANLNYEVTSRRIFMQACSLVIDRLRQPCERWAVTPHPCTCLVSALHACNN